MSATCNFLVKLLSSEDALVHYIGGRDTSVPLVGFPETPSSARDHVLTVKEGAFEFFPLHRLPVVPPIIAPETKTVLLSGGLKTKTKTGTVPGAPQCQRQRLPLQADER